MYSLMMEHTALVVDNKTLIVVVTFRAWKMNEEIKGIIAEYVEKKFSQYKELVHQEHLRDVEEALKSYSVNCNRMSSRGYDRHACVFVHPRRGACLSSTACVEF